MRNESVLVVPLRSNASTLVAGAPVARLRRRLKFASLFFDRLLLETGIYKVSAGPRGASSFIVPPDEDNPPRWQTAADRHAQTGRKFTVGWSEEPPPEGARRAGWSPQPLFTSEATISWAATLHPFADELPAGANWVEWVTPVDRSGEIGQLAERWNRQDARNPALERAIPSEFVRGEVIKRTNSDLAFASAAGFAATLDPLHQQVAAQRFNDDDGWKLSGYAVPLLFPWVGELPWEAIVELRRDKSMARFRSELREVEEEAMAEAALGDVRAAAEHAYRQHLAGYSETLPSVGGIAHRSLTGFVIGGIAGFSVYGIVGPLSVVAASGLGAAVGTVMDIREVIRGRRSRGWICMDQRIEAMRSS